jgi:hypothetical protein
VSPYRSDLSSQSASPPPPQISVNAAFGGGNMPMVSTPGIDDEVIPTAIVIKNIPFNVKRDTLLDIIVRLC